MALLLTALANTGANRRVTFGIRAREAMIRHHVQGLAVFGLALAITSLSLSGLHAISRHPSRAAEVVVLVLANLMATIARFLLLRGWVFRSLLSGSTRSQS